MPQIQILAPVPPALQEVLSPAALEFVVDLERRFGPRRRDCLLYTSPSPRDRTRSRMPSSA